jgi:MFS family permease
MTRVLPDWKPKPEEAVVMSGIYGLATLLLIFILAGIITPSRDHQLRGWRRARKQGASSLPHLADAATSFWFVIVMALAGAAGWFLFTQALVESRWFPGHEVPLRVLGFFVAVMLTGGVGFQALLEAKGGRFVGMMALFVGILPVMAGTILGTISNRLIPLASWLAGISPLSMPFYASGTLLTLAELPVHAARAVPRAFFFWLFVAVLITIWLIIRLRSARKAMASSVLNASGDVHSVH